LEKLNNPRFYGDFFGLLKAACFALCAIFVLAGCEESDEIGLDLIDSHVRLQTIDTLKVLAYTMPDDSVATNFASTNVLGVIDDPVFGKTRASIYTETRLAMNDLSLGEDPVLDSIHLVMAYTGQYYGNVEVFHNIRVYELSENFPEADTLFSSMDIPHKPEPITLDPGGFLLRPAPTDSVMVDTILLPPHIRIPLSPAFGQKIIDANGTPAFENVPNYLEAFKGLFITLDAQTDETGSLYSLNMLAGMTSLELFYRNQGDTVSRMQRFPINEFAKRSSRVEHFGFDETHEVLRAQVQDQELALGDSLLFVQSLGVLRSNIHFPHLEELADLPRVLINKAQMVVPVDVDFVTELLPPSRQLLLLRYTDDDELEFLRDFQVGQSYFGGVFDAATNQYTFNITQYVQQVLDDIHPNKGLALVVAGAGENMSRVVLRGPGRQENPMRLEIFYTVFE